MVLRSLVVEAGFEAGGGSTGASEGPEALSDEATDPSVTSRPPGAMNLISWNCRGGGNSHTV